MEFFMISQFNALIVMLAGVLYLLIEKKYRVTFLKWVALGQVGMLGAIILFILVHHMY